MFQSLCGQEALKNVFLTTTQWLNVDPVEGQARENNLRDPGLWGQLISRGATLRRFDGTRESGLGLIGDLMSNTPKPLRIQEQIVKQQMTLPETDAGKFLKEVLATRGRRLRAELESLGKQLREFMEVEDDEMSRILVEEQTRAREKLEKAEAEQKLLGRLHAAGIEERGRTVIAPDTAAGPSHLRTRRAKPVTMYSPSVTRRET